MSVIRRNSLKQDLQLIRKRADGYYMPIFAQGGGAKIFWSYAGRTRAAAESAVRKMHQPTKPAVGLAPDQKQQFALIIKKFRAAETATFNKKYKIGFYTDYPWRFSGANRDNPTTELFDISGLKYEFVESEQILAGQIKQYAAIFFPGGFGYFFNATMARRIKGYVRAGGGLFGFCSGAFFPLKNYLGLCDSTYVYFREQGFADVLLNPRDPLALGMKGSQRPVCYALYPKPTFLRNYTLRMKIKRCNGPLLVRRGRDIAPAYFDSTEKYSPIIRADYGKGRVVLVSPHPDNSMAEILKATGEDNLIDTLKLFKNIALFCAGYG